MNIERLFFELLQIAIGNKESLSVAPTQEQWAELFALSKKQALVAVAFAGVNSLKEASDSDDDFGLSVGIDEITFLQWLGLKVKIGSVGKCQ